MTQLILETGKVSLSCGTNLTFYLRPTERERSGTSDFMFSGGTYNARARTDWSHDLSVNRISILRVLPPFSAYEALLLIVDTRAA